MKNLMSMTDFVLEQEINKEFNNSNKWKDCLSYAKILKQTNEKWMFVPCDEDGNVLEDPIFKNTLNSDKHHALCEIYQKAKERCLFENVFFIRNCGIHGISIETLKHHYIFNSNGKNTNLIIEDLVKYNLQLTPTAIKQLGL